MKIDDDRLLCSVDMWELEFFLFLCLPPFLKLIKNDTGSIKKFDGFAFFRKIPFFSNVRVVLQINLFTFFKCSSIVYYVVDNNKNCPVTCIEPLFCYIIHGGDTLHVQLHPISTKSPFYSTFDTSYSVIYLWKIITQIYWQCTFGGSSIM